MEASGDWSDWMKISRSCLIGCVWATDFARAYMYVIIEEAHYMVESAMFESYVDDVECYLEGTTEQVQERFLVGPCGSH